MTTPAERALNTGEATRGGPRPRKAADLSGCVIKIDTREQRPWSFDGELVRRLVGELPPPVVGTLATGDYSLVGLEHEVALERKSLEDFVGSVIQERERFWRELERLAAIRVRGVLVEASVEDVKRGRYRSQARPQAVMASALAIVTDFGIPVAWCGTREDAEYQAAWMLRRVWQRHQAQKGGEG